VWLSVHSAAELFLGSRSVNPRVTACLLGADCSLLMYAFCHQLLVVHGNVAGYQVSTCEIMHVRMDGWMDGWMDA
jgi:hypothetical protein